MIEVFKEYVNLLPEGDLDKLFKVGFFNFQKFLNYN